MNDAQFPPRPTTLAQDILKPLIIPGDTVIDATAGNGYDTAFLANCTGPSGKVLAFDVQMMALTATRRLLEEQCLSARVELILGSHATMEAHAAVGSVSVVMFNLGYLPGEDHTRTTEAAETVFALEGAGRVLKAGGMLSVICYPGHPAGAMEADAVEDWLETMTAVGWRVARYGATGTRRPAPFLLVARTKS